MCIVLELRSFGWLDSHIGFYLFSNTSNTTAHVVTGYSETVDEK